MSKTTKLVLGIVIAAMVLGGGYAYWQSSQTAAMPESPEVTTLPSGTDKSDGALDADLKAIDSQLKDVGTDATNLSASVSAAQSQ
jgi:hypothetical protein